MAIREHISSKYLYDDTPMISVNSFKITFITKLLLTIRNEVIYEVSYCFSFKR